MYWPINEFSINEIFLDTKNIRLPVSNKDQDDIIQDLFSNEDAFELVKSFAKFGVFQDEFPIVIKENKKYTVIEGNRRLAALKAMDNPERVPLFKERLKALNHEGFQTIRATLAPNRAEAVALIANKHTASLRRPWKPLRQAYFYKSQIDNGKQIEQIQAEYPDFDIPKFIRMLEMHHIAKSVEYDTDSTTLLVHDERKFPITNLERMYEDPYVRNYLGIEFSPTGNINIKSNVEDFKKVIKVITTDVATGAIDSRKYNKGDQRKGYIDKLPTELKPKLQTNHVVKSDSFSEQKVDKEKLKNGKRNGKKLVGLIPGFIQFELNSSSLKTIFEELRRLPVDDFPNSAHDVLRSFLECSLVFYLKEVNEYKLVKKAAQHNPKLDEMLTHITSDKSKCIKDGNLRQIVEHIKKDYTQSYSLARLNMINHNENCVSTPREVRDAWSKIEPLMKYILSGKKDE